MKPSPTNLSHLEKQKNQRYAALQASINNLRGRLQNFSVVNQLEQMIGRVADIILDANNRPNLVIVQPDENDAPVVTLSTGLIQNVDVKSRLIQVDAEVMPSDTPMEPSSAPVAPSSTAPDSARVSESTPSIPPPMPVNTAGKPESDTMIASPINQENPDVTAGDFDQTISLLAERLKVDYNRRKIGEVVVRKTIETRLVEVPVRYERLIVEQVSPEHKHLADVRLGDDSLPDHLEQSDRQLPATGNPVVSGEFATPGIASQVLNAIARLPHACQNVRIEIELADPSLVDTYQRWLNSEH